MKSGDTVTLTHGDTTVLATVLVCSDNQRSLFVTFDDRIAEHIGAMPILMDDDGVYRSLIGGFALEVRPLS